MPELKDIAAEITLTYWNRKASESELTAMTGEMKRDSTLMKAGQNRQDDTFFAIEPLHYSALLLKDVKE